MKLLVVCRPLVFHGGVERATAGLLGGLVEHGDEVHLLSPGRDPALPGVVHRRLVLPPAPAPLRPLVLAAAVSIARGRGRWDVVQSHERTLAQDVYRAGEGCHRAWLAARGRPGRALYNAVVLAIERRLFRTTPRIVAIARAGKAEIESLYGVPPRRVDVVYNGVDLVRFHPASCARVRVSARAEARVPAGASALLFVGSGFERKGLGTALEALARIRADARLIVLGRGNVDAYQAQARRLGIEERVIWLGARPDVERWYGAADVVVLPTTYEPFGNVHLEALASGVPIVTTSRAGGAEIVDDTRGAVVAPGDPRALAEAVERLGARSRDDLIAACRTAAEPFTYAAQVAGFHSVYRTARSDCS
jgi:UDP-glucose:(heptosyl)LPS alpha-1,3-glucosyltransferase